MKRGCTPRQPGDAATAPPNERTLSISRYRVTPVSVYPSIMTVKRPTMTFPTTGNPRDILFAPAPPPVASSRDFHGGIQAPVAVHVEPSKWRATQVRFDTHTDEYLDRITAAARAAGRRDVSVSALIRHALGRLADTPDTDVIQGIPNGRAR